MKNILSILSIFLLSLLVACEVEVKSSAKCGDGNLNPGEQCDQDNLSTQTCVTLGYHGGELACSNSCTFEISSCLQAGRCGDDQVQRFSEDCDGEALDDQTCVTLGYHGGELACGADCTVDTASCEAAGRCGDGLVQSGFGEACDGTSLDGQTCESQGFYGGTLACGAGCAFDTTGCEQEIFCGDDLIQTAWGETCDGANLDGKTCLTLGYYGGALACGDDCRLDLTSCETAGRCGDDLIQTASGETCDGANLDGQSCTTLGFATGTLSCDPGCTFDTGACFNWTSIATGGGHTCAIGPDATVWCWGANDYGQLGNGTTTDSPSPVQVSGLTGIRWIAAGYFFTCAVRDDGTVWCWGDNSEEQLGDLTTTTRTSPVQTFFINNAETVDAGLANTCAQLTDGTVKCWGENSIGQCGDGTTTDRASPVTVLGVAGVDSISVGEYSACAHLSDGTLRCWGANDYGQLGDGTVGGFSATAVAVSGVTTARTISVGLNHACAVLAGGALACWGNNGAGQCGDGTTSDHATATTIWNLTAAAAVSCGDSYACALLNDGTLRCWGHNPYGQLGDGTTESRLSPVAVQNLTSAASVSCAANHACAATASSTLYCWGLNSRGQLGDGTTTNSSVPVEVQ